MKTKVAVLGSHKGLGYECVKALLGLEREVQVLGLSRKDNDDFRSNLNYSFLTFDFTMAYKDPALFMEIKHQLGLFDPDCFIYAAGGGPYGVLDAKDWKDHEWAIQLNFLFPAKLIWSLSQMPSTKKRHFLYVGSAIAESEEGDLMGPSYAASKWAMKGLIKSFQSEYLKLELISPGYMDTDLLPLGSKPRTSGQTLLKPKDVAYEILLQLKLI